MWNGRACSPKMGSPHPLLMNSVTSTLQFPTREESALSDRRTHICSYCSSQYDFLSRERKSREWEREWRWKEISEQSGWVNYMNNAIVLNFHYVHKSNKWGKSVNIYESIIYWATLVYYLNEYKWKDWCKDTLFKLFICGLLNSVHLSNHPIW